MKILKRALALTLAITLAVGPLSTFQRVPKEAKAVTTVEGMKNAEKWKTEGLIDSLEKNKGWNTGKAADSYNKALAAVKELGEKYEKEFGPNKRPFLTWAITDKMATSSIGWETMKLYR